MKRFAAVLFALILCMTTAAGLAEREPVVRSQSLAAYEDGQGNVYIPGREEAVNKAEATGIVSIDAYRVVYLAAAEDATADDATDLHVIDLETFEDTAVVEAVTTACTISDCIYYVPDEDRETLMCLDLTDNTTKTIYEAAEVIERLYASVEGLVFELSDQSGTLLYDPSTENVSTFSGSIPRRGLITDDWEVYLNDEEELIIKDAASYEAVTIDTNVVAFTELDGIIYYLTDDGTTQTLSSYDHSVGLSGEIATDLEGMTAQLTASTGSLYTIDDKGVIYAFDPDSTAEGKVVADYADTSGFDLPEGTEVIGLQIEGMPGCLNVYATIEDEDAVPDFTFIEFESDIEAAETRLFLLDSIAIEEEDTSWESMKPIEQQYMTLARGSRGDAVRAIQQPLYDLGYYDYYVDGIFGPRTQWAIRLLQADLNLPDNGIADAALQRTILSGKLSAYDPYIPLPRGSRGLRVQIMQQRLRDLGYLADSADRIFGGRTQKAVQLFQAENGLIVSSRATRATLRRLYSDAAVPCSSYIDLYPGDTGYRVRALNDRLRELYYLESSIGSAYTAETTSAVHVFQRTAGLPLTGYASAELQALLFSDDAPEAEGYIVLRRGDMNSRVTQLQRRLMELGYYTGPIDGYYGRETQAAVSLFQQKVGLVVTGVATVRTQQLLFSNDAPVYVRPTYIGVPYISLDTFDYQDGGIYYIAEESSANGYVTFNWFAEGEVDYYDVRIVDNYGNHFLGQQTMLNRTGVSISTLRLGSVYTLSVTAWPADGNAAHATTAQLMFARILRQPVTPPTPQIGRIGNPKLSIQTVARVENGVQYIMPGKVVFNWHADGELGYYRISVVDESGAELLEIGNTTDESTRLNTNQLTSGEIYTLYVYAIPRGGTMENARMRSLRFCLPEIELPEPEPDPEPEPAAPGTPISQPEPLSIPTISFDPVEYTSDGVDYLSGDTLTLSWQADGDVDRYLIQLTGDDGNTVTSGKTTNTSLVMNRSKLKLDMVYTFNVTAIPVNGTESDGTFASAQFALYAPPADDAQPDVYDDSHVNEDDIIEDETEEDDAITEGEPEAGDEPAGGDEPDEPDETDDAGESADDDVPVDGGLAAPVISLTPVIESRDGVDYIDADQIVMNWHCEGDAVSYEVTLQDSSGAALANAQTTDTTISMKTRGMQAGEVYTLIVSATAADGATASGSSSFALYTGDEPLVPDDATPETPVGEPTEDGVAEDEASPVDDAAPETDEAPVDEADSQPGADEPQVPADGASSAPIGTPVISLDPIVSYVGDTACVAGGKLNISWSCEGDVAAYEVSLLDEGGNVLASTSTTQNALSIDASGMQADVVYMLQVRAIPADGGDATEAAVPFSKYVEPEADITEETAPDEPVEDVPPVPEDEPYEAADEAYDEADETYEEAGEGDIDVPEAPVDEVYSEPIGTPVITLDPVASYEGGVEYVSGDRLTITWACDGAVASYEVSLLDGNGATLASQSTADSMLALATVNMQVDTVYTLQVRAIPADGGDATEASVLFAKYVEPADTAVEDTYGADADVGDTAYASEDEPYEAPDEGTYEESYEAPDEGTYEQSYDAPVQEDYAEPAYESEDTAVEAEPYEAPVQEAPAYEPVGTPVINLDPVMDVSGTISLIGGDNLNIHWYADGDVQSYEVALYNSYGNIEASTTTAENALGIPTSRMSPGEVYTLTITALPMDSSMSPADASVQFMLYSEPEEAPEIESEESYPDYEDEDEPAYDDAYADESYDEPDYGTGGYDGGYADETAYTESNTVDSAYGEPAYEAYADSEPQYAQSDYAEPDYADQEDTDYTGMEDADPTDTDPSCDGQTLPEGQDGTAPYGEFDAYGAYGEYGQYDAYGEYGEYNGVDDAGMQPYAEGEYGDGAYPMTGDQARDSMGYGEYSYE